MWENLTRPRLGGVSLMRYALNFLLVLSATLLWAIIFTPAAHAADATWESGSIVYQDNSYQGPTTVDREMSQRLGVPENSQYYQYIEQGDADAPDDVSQAKFVTFGPGDSVEDATNAQVFSCELNTRTSQDEYSNCTNPTGVSIDAQSSVEGGGAQEETSCVVNGIGYVVCPFMNFLADTMDKVYDVLKRFLHVTPLSTDTDNGLYKAWSYMLAIANVMFVIGFLVIIYSYITNQGVKQYDLRGIIPRIIVAAVLINASYIICAGAVDLSNVIGSSLQDVFNNIRKELAPNDVTSASTWSSITTYALSGGTIGAAGAAAFFAASAYGAASIYLLVPMLISAVIAVLVVVVILAARYALITVLIVLAPLAFAAFILPSTQKYFDKWKDVFMTMLIMYPMFAMLFGGSQLAATIIAQNATSFLVIIFAMFIQVAPLVITPFLIKFSGSLLGRIAGMVNNPAKGLGDRAKNASQARLDEAKDRRLQEKNRGWGSTPGLALAQKLDTGKRDREGRRKKYQSNRNAAYAAQSTQTFIEQQRAEDLAKAAETRNNAAYEAQKLTNSTAKREAVQNQMADMSLHNNKAQFEGYMKELESQKGAKLHARNGDNVAASLGHQVHSLAQDHMIQDSRKGFAESAHRVEYAHNMVDSRALQQAAAGIGGESAEKLATARATQQIREDFGKGASAQTELLKHFSAGLDNSALKNLALGGVAKGKDSRGREYEFDASEIGSELHEAAVAKFLKETNYEGASDIVRAASDNREAWRSVHGTIKEGVIATHGSKAPFLMGQALDRIDQGNANSAGGYERMIIDYVNKAKFKAEALAGADAVALEDILGVMKAYHDNTIPAGAGLTREDRDLFGQRMQDLIDAAADTLADTQVASTMPKINKERLLAIKNFNSIR
ncbi:MAG: hypothetical protein UY35_C0007G0027 [Candidatus Saccharibacteria bacterium GW2011_GWC2_48_9]|nr:MAG: hypothetical protein UY35_C0007G0027 [Candidatus Saccharibacteria bacterium GW2011_GWC2_48_9]